MLKFTPSILLALTVAVIGAGCGEGTLPRKTVYPVSGKVTMLGAPLIEATVTFGPLDGQPLAYGKTNDAGEYKLTTYSSNDGAAVGNYSVIVTKSVAGASGGAAAAHGTTAGVNYLSGSHAGGKASKKASNSVISPEFSDTNKTPLKFKVEAKSDNRYDFEVK